MKKLIALSLVLLLLCVSINFATNDKGKLDVVGIKNSQAIYKVNQNYDNENITFEKKNDKEYDVKVGNQKIFSFKVKNNINANNQLLDCGILTCDFVLELNPAQVMRFDAEQISGGWQFGDAQLQKVFYYKNESYIVNEPIYQQRQGENCYEANATNASYCEQYIYYEQIGTNQITRYRMAEKTDWEYFDFEPSIKTQVVIRFSKPNPTERVDIYPTIYGNEFREWAWWNESCDYSMPLTTNLVNGVANQTWNEENFLAIVEMENISTNATLLNLTNFDNVAFTDITNTTKLNSSIMQANTTHVFYRVVIPTQTNSTSITAWFCENDYQASDNQSVCDNTNLRSLWGGNNLLDMCKENNLTVVGSAASAGADYNCKYGKCFNIGETSWFNSTVIGNHQTSNNPSTVSMWAFLNNGFDTNFQSLFGFGVSGTNTFRANFWYNTGGGQFWQSIGSANPALSFTGSWATKQTYYAGIVNSTGLYSIYNQTSAFNANTAANTGASYITIGYATSYASIADGATTNASMSEVRLYDESKSLDYLKAEYGIIYKQAGDIEQQPTLSQITAKIYNSSNGTEFYTDDDLFGWITLTDTTDAQYNITYKWFKDDVEQTSGVIQNLASNSSGISYNINNISSTLTSKGESWILQVNASNDNGDTINATNSSTITILNSKPILDTLDFVANGSAFILGEVEANITFSDTDADAMTCYYNWFKNNVNQTALAGSSACTNGTAINVNAGSSPYTVGDNWSIRVWANDSDNTSIYTNSSNTTIQNYTSNLSVNYTSSQFDVYTYPYYLNITKEGGVSINASLNIFGNTYTPTNLGDTTNYQFNVSLAPSDISEQTNYSAVWYYTVVLANSTEYSENYTFNITVNPAGVIECGTLSNTTGLQYSVYDALNSTQLNASAVLTIYSTLSSLTRITSLSTTNETIYLCISPTNETFNTTINEQWTLTNYEPATTSRTLSVSNTTQNVSVYLYPSSVAKTTQLKVLQTSNIPIANVNITVERYIAPSNYTIYTSCTTGEAGTCIVYLYPNNHIYRYNLTYEGTVYSFGPEALSCDSSSLTCYRTFELSSAVVIPYYLNPNWTGSCTYSNITKTISCSGSDTGNIIQNYYLDIFELGNITTDCTNTTAGSTTSLSCTHSDLNTTFIWQFYGQDAGGSYYYLDSGQINNQTFNARFGNEGWLAMFILFGVIALAGAYSLVLSMFLGVLSLIAAILLGIAPAGQFTPLIFLLAVVAGVIAYKMRGVR